MPIDWDKVADELCGCGHKKSEHSPHNGPAEGNGPCDIACCGCFKFTWKEFILEED